MYLWFIKDICPYRASGLSSRPQTGLKKEWYLLNHYIAGAKRAGLSAIGEVWLMHIADAQCMPEGKSSKEQKKEKKKNKPSDISCLVLKHEFYFTTVNTLLISFSFTRSRILCHSLVSTLSFICFPCKHQVPPTKLDNPRKLLHACAVKSSAFICRQGESPHVPSLRHL